MGAKCRLKKVQKKSMQSILWAYKYMYFHSRYMYNDYPSIRPTYNFSDHMSVVPTTFSRGLIFITDIDVYKVHEQIILRNYI